MAGRKTASFEETRRNDLILRVVIPVLVTLRWSRSGPSQSGRRMRRHISCPDHGPWQRRW